jgi:ArsR family transcriptional regulator
MNEEDEMDEEHFAEISRALAHPARVRIVNLLSVQSECRGADVFGELDLAQSTISEHLRILRETGLVSSRPVGTSNVYCIVAGPLAEYAEHAAELAAASAHCAPASGACA